LLWNAEGLGNSPSNPKIADIVSIIDKQNIKLVCLVETWWDGARDSVVPVGWQGAVGSTYWTICPLYAICMCHAPVALRACLCRTFSRSFDIVSEFIIQSALVIYRFAARLQQRPMQKEKSPECQPKAKMVAK